MKRFFIFLLIIFCIATACNKEASGTDNADHASVSVYAVAPDAPEFNLFLNGNNVAVRVQFGSYTLYNRVVAGDVSLHAQSTSRNINLDTSFSAVANQYYSVFLAGNATSIRPLVLQDHLPALKQDSCGLRFFVFSPGISDIDFRIVSTDAVAAKSNSWSKRSYPDDISSDTTNTFRSFAAGTYSFYAIRNATKDTLARFTNRSFSDSANYTLMLEGHFAQGDTSLLLGTRMHNQ